MCSNAAARAAPPGDARQDWRILQDIARALEAIGVTILAGGVSLDGADVIVQTLDDLDLSVPKLTASQRRTLARARRMLTR